MSDLISRAEALKYIPSEEPISRMVIAQLPTIEAEPVKHGRWTTEHLCTTAGGTYPIERCSECEYASVVGKTHYCPNCGAKMQSTMGQVKPTEGVNEK